MRCVGMRERVFWGIDMVDWFVLFLLMFRVSRFLRFGDGGAGLSVGGWVNGL